MNIIIRLGFYYCLRGFADSFKLSDHIDHGKTVRWIKGPACVDYCPDRGPILETLKVCRSGRFYTDPYVLNDDAIPGTMMVGIVSGKKL